jgi:AraC family transcriptional regulator
MASGPYEKRMLRVLEHIHDNPDGDLSLDALADIAAMSRFHWHRVFVAMTGETCAQAVRRIRLNRAAVWLVQSDQPIAQIARRVGYPSVQSFGRAFRLSYGLTPARFRKEGTAGAPYLQTRERPYPMFTVSVEHEPNRILGAMEHQGAYAEIGKAFESLSAIIATRNLWPQVRGMVGIYFDDPDATLPQDLRACAGVVLADGNVPDGLQRYEVPGGKVARLRHIGPYSSLHLAYGHLYGTWLPQSGEEPADQPPYEVYHNGPADTAPQDLVTDICVPLKG